METGVASCKRFLSDESGGMAVAYTVILAAAGLFLIGGMAVLGKGLSSVFFDLANFFASN